MLGRIPLLVMATFFLATLAIAGCGGEEKVETKAQGEVVQFTTPAIPEGDLTQLFEQLKKNEMTVEIVDNGQTRGKWSQNSEGSWRLDDPDDPSTYTIYNAPMMKGWQVTGNTAIELNPATAQIYQATGPLAAMGSYIAFAGFPRTSTSADVWEWTSVPNLGSLRIEFKGPGGLISKITSETPTAGKSEIDFNYSNVDDVPDSTFELPAGVQVAPAPTLPAVPGGTGDAGGY